MRRKIGIFQTEQQVVNCVQLLQTNGFVPGEMHIVAKDDEHSRRIEHESGLHADELQELAETRYESKDITDSYALAAFMPMPGGAGTWNGVPAVYGSYGIWNKQDHDGFTAALESLGLSDDEAEQCINEIRAGKTIVYVESDESPTLFDHDGGPDLSRLGIAEGIFRQAGASRVI
ncbi:general stress protein [Paenibacillus protaetiae]|nr:general stress protein [Paenibacillus protaetiae]